METGDRTRRRYQRSLNAVPKAKAEWLSPKEEIFVGEYLKHLNSSRAYRAAGYKVSKAQSGYLGSVLLGKPKIQRAIQRAMDARAERTNVTIDKVVKELGKLAFTNMQDYYDKWDSTGFYLKDSKELTLEQTAAIESMEALDTPFGIKIKFKLYSKQAALALLREHLVAPKVQPPEDMNETIRKLQQGMRYARQMMGQPGEGEEGQDKEG